MRVIQVNFTDNKPTYIQIADAFRNAIHDGQFGPGAPLPGKNALANDLGVCHTTIAKAWGVLAEEGLVVRRSGAGTFVTMTDDPTRSNSAAIDDLRAQLEELKERVDRLTEALAHHRD